MVQDLGSFEGRLGDRSEIHDVIYRWCQGVDRRDYEAVRDAYHDDAIDARGAYEGNVDGLIEWLQRRHETIPYSMHLVGNIVVDFAGSDVALAETYLWMTQHYPESARASLEQILGPAAGDFEGAVDFVATARYVDRFERREKRWRIARRTVVNGRVMVSKAAIPMRERPGFVSDRRDNDDLLFRERRALKLA